MKEKRKLPVLAIVALLVVVVAITIALTRSSEQSVLNDGEPVAEVSPDKLAAELKRLTLGLKGDFYDADRRRMDYEAAARSEEFKQFVQVARALRAFDLSLLKSREEKLAFWINLYNALTVHAIIAFKPKKSVWDVKGFFNRSAYNVGGYRFSLNEIENGVLRANRPGPYGLLKPFSAGDARRRFALTDAEFDPRIHFALNCGSRSCPPIAFYDPAKIDEQLDLAAKAFIRSETQVRADDVVTSSIFKWYRNDFGNDVASFIVKYLDEGTRQRLHGKQLRVSFTKYDWSLNH